MDILKNEFTLHNIYSSAIIIRIIKSRRMKWTGHVACLKERRNACRVLVGMPEGKRLQGRRRWEDE
jgi:hypothetical protein